MENEFGTANVDAVIEIILEKGYIHEFKVSGSDA
jgi:ribosome maturation protein Sdo1